MLYKEYGRTGKKISVISAGGMRLPQPDRPAEAVATLLRAYEKGVNYFDTAPIYCDDRSENIVGQAIRDMQPGSFYVSSKCAAADGPGLRAGLERSLARLGLARIHFFHVWCVMTPDDWAQRKAQGAVAAAIQARAEGLVEHLAFSTHMAGRDIRGVVDEHIFEGMTVGYCAMNFPYRQEGVDAAAAAGLGVVAMNPLGGGLIPANPRVFDFLRGPRDPDAVTAALRFLVSQPTITSALVGFSSRAHVDQAMAAVENFEPYPAPHVDRLKQRIRADFDQLCTGCGYCLPCPQQVPIPQFMDVYNGKMLQANRADIMARFQWHWDLKPAVAGACIKCGQCEGKCTQHLPIMRRLEQLKEEYAG